MDEFYVGNAGCQENATTYNAWIMGDVGSAAFTGNPPLRTIRNGILFGVHGRLFMPIAYNAFVGTSWKEPIVSLTYNSILAYKQASYL